MALAKELTHYPSGRKLSCTEKCILLVLSDTYNDEQRYAWPAIDTIAEHCCISARQVVRVLKSLEEGGLIQRTNRYKDSNLYSLLFVSGISRTTPQVTAPVTPDGQQTQELNAKVELNPPNPPAGGSVSPALADYKQAELAIADQLWDYFVTKAKKTGRLAFDDKRKKMAMDCLRELLRVRQDLSIEQAVVNMECAIQCMCESEYHVQNGYVEWEQVFRNYKRYEQWSERARARGI